MTLILFLIAYAVGSLIATVLYAYMEGNTVDVFPVAAFWPFFLLLFAIAIPFFVAGDIGMWLRRRYR